MLLHGGPMVVGCRARAYFKVEAVRLQELSRRVPELVAQQFQKSLDKKKWKKEPDLGGPLIENSLSLMWRDEVPSARAGE